jgi:polyisoprenoid-binding protein YceI
VAAASLETRNTQCDTHLRSADIFDSSNHPHVSFTAGGMRPSGQDVAVVGALIVRR